MRSHSPALPKALLRAASVANNGRVPIAEINRKVGETAELLGVLRPSYELVRLAVHHQRRRRMEPTLAEVALDVAFRVRPPEAIADQLAGTLPVPRSTGGK